MDYAKRAQPEGFTSTAPLSEDKVRGTILEG